MPEAAAATPADAAATPATIEIPPRGTRGARLPTPPGWLMGALLRIWVLAWRALGDRMRVQGRPLLLLTTIGARSGRRRRAMLGWWPDRDGWLVVASNAGAANHPGWFFNLAARPDGAWVEVARRSRAVRASALHGSELEAAWTRVTRDAPGYGTYREKTDRRIPIVRLEPLDGGG
jgi:deazaflavin-dependent oxidoreductase (nitroreductase family)